jgi:hypothetical protein
MKAAVLKELGGPPVYEDADEPVDCCGHLSGASADRLSVGAD